MLRHDRATLARLPPERWLAALFATDLRGAVMSLIEMTLHPVGFHDPRADVTGTMNAWGDHIGHTPALAAASAGALAIATPAHVSAAAIRTGDGSAVIAGFVAWAEAHGVTVVGGLPTGFDDTPLPDDTLIAIRTVYLASGGRFLVLPGLSRYQRSAFFDTPEHLNEPAQIAHSRLIARALFTPSPCGRGQGGGGRGGGSTGEGSSNTDPGPL